MGRLAHILVNQAYARSLVEPTSVEWEEGEPAAGPTWVDGPPFAAILFLPLGTETANPLGRRITQPTLMWEDRPDGSVVEVLPTDRLVVTAPELAPYTGGSPSEWLVDGRPQPFGPPGSVIGAWTNLRRVEDG